MAKPKKKKSFWKKAAKAALIGGALYAGAKGLGKRAKGKVNIGSENLNIGSKGPQIPDIHNYKKKWNMPHDEVFGNGIGIAKGGRVSKKGGGRTGKQFGGGLNRAVARRDMRSGYYPSDMGMRGGTMYKKGGRVKSRGVAKRGGGAEIK